MKRMNVAATALLFVLAMAGCAKIDTGFADETEVLFNASFADDTKTACQSDGRVDWVAGDHIKYYSGAKATVNDYEVAESGHYTPVLAKVAAGTSFIVAAYGCSGISDHTATSFTMTGAVNAVQDGTFASAHASVAKTTSVQNGSMLSFHNITSLIKFTLERNDVAYALFKANAGETIQSDGVLAVTVSDEGAGAAFAEDGSSSIRVNTNGAGTFYVSTLPVTLAGGFTILLYDASDNYLGAVDANTALTLGKDQIANLGVLDGRVYVKTLSIELGAKAVMLGVNDTYKLPAIVLPENSKDKSLIWSVDDESVARVDAGGNVTAVAFGSTVLTARSSDNGDTAKVNVYVTDMTKAVDMGLSVKWACRNVGASDPSGYGDYFAWGETAPYYESGSASSVSPVWKDGKSSGYEWPSYKWCNSALDSLTKYNARSEYGARDGRTVLESADDAVCSQWSGSWRMPTDAEWTELRQNCTLTWSNVNGVNGLICVSNRTGNMIFLPASGNRYATDLILAGSYGFYWSSSLYEDFSLAAYDVVFNCDGMARNYHARYNGLSMRPVTR